MGASGAGKTTLLNVLTFKNQGNLQIAADIRINGKLITSGNQLASISGYVQQNDIFIGTLKVKEHLRFQAMLRMGEEKSDAEKHERVEQILNERIIQFFF
jgi:ABC-type multidrug transport system ATPase subunit